METIIAKIYKNDIFSERQNDVRNVSGIEMLKEIERKLENNLKDLKHLKAWNPALVLEEEKKCIVDMRKMANQAKQE